MNMNLRDLILAGASIGVLGLTGCGTYSPDKPLTVAAQYQNSGLAECPLNEDLRQASCSSLEEAGYDFLVPMRIQPGAPLAICGCNVDIGDPRELTDKQYKGGDVLFGGSIEGSHCRELCAATTGGSGTEYRECVAICKAEHD